MEGNPGSASSLHPPTVPSSRSSRATSPRSRWQSKVTLSCFGSSSSSSSSWRAAAQSRRKVAARLKALTAPSASASPDAKARLSMYPASWSGPAATALAAEVTVSRPIQSRPRARAMESALRKWGSSERCPMVKARPALGLGALAAAGAGAGAGAGAAAFALGLGA